MRKFILLISCHLSTSGDVVLLLILFSKELITPDPPTQGWGLDTFKEHGLVGVCACVCMRAHAPPAFTQPPPSPQTAPWRLLTLEPWSSFPQFTFAVEKYMPNANSEYSKYPKYQSHSTFTIMPYHQPEELLCT